MEKIWNIFWKLFGVLMLLAVASAIIMGFVSHSAAAAFAGIQKTIVAGFGICGFIGLVVVPVEMFFTHRAQGEGAENAAE
jgi:uncharacterized membrane protein